MNSIVLNCKSTARSTVATDRDPPSVLGRFEAAVSPARIKDGFVGSERRSTA